MLIDPDYRAAIEALPFAPGDRVAAVGDSLTADRLGWFDLIARSMAAAGHPAVVTGNLAVSGSTTADALERFDILEAFQPTHVMVLLGTNDARRHGRIRPQRMVSLAETERNLAALIELVAELSAEVLVVTPPPGDQSRISLFFDDNPVQWSAADLDAIADVVRRSTPQSIDVRAALRADQLPSLMESDGVHLNPAGQQVLARHVVQALNTTDPWSRGAPAASSAAPDR